jgi:MYXO-CTERM domain-containing protein
MFANPSMGSRSSEVLMVLRRIKAFMLLSTLAGACGGIVPSDPVSTGEQAIIGGQVCTDRPSTVALVVRMGGLEQFCSGTLIGKRHVLTAGHCIALSGIPTSHMGVFFGTDVSRNDGPTLSVRSVTVHPNFNNRDISNDLAVVELVSDAPVNPAPMPKVPLARSDIGKDLIMVGFGVDNAQTETGNGVKRTTTLRLKDLDNSHLYYGDRTRGTCQGDSGGSSYLVQDGVFVLVGVTSYGSQDCVSMGADTRVDAYRDWILSQIARDTVGPDLSVEAPTDGEHVPTSFEASVRATDPNGVVQVVIEVDGQRVAATTSEPFQIPLDLAPGPHTVTVRAADLYWNWSEQSMAIIVDCSTNEQCGSGRICSMATCVEPASLGGECVADTDCPEGKCVLGSDGVKVCSRLCTNAGDCPPAYECGAGVCVRRLAIPQGAVGAPCSSDAQCASGICVGAETPSGFCSTTCDPSSSCPNDAVCGEAPAGSNLCGPPRLKSNRTSGCSANADPSSSPMAMAWAILAAAALWRGRRSRRSTRA